MLFWQWRRGPVPHVLTDCMSSPGRSNVGAYNGWTGPDTNWPGTGLSLQTATQHIEVLADGFTYAVSRYKVQPRRATKTGQNWTQVRAGHTGPQCRNIEMTGAGLEPTFKSGDAPWPLQASTT